MSEIIFSQEKKVWTPSTSSSSLVITLPKVDFLKEGDKVTVKVDSDKKIIIEKSGGT